MRCAEARALAAARALPAPVEGVAAALLHCDAKCRARALRSGPIPVSKQTAVCRLQVLDAHKLMPDKARGTSH